jgi:hypothetical protein
MKVSEKNPRDHGKRLEENLEEQPQYNEALIYA